MSPLLSPIFFVVTWWHVVMITWIHWLGLPYSPLPYSSGRRCCQVTQLLDWLYLTDLGAFSQRERDAEASQPAVRVDHHVGDRIVGIGVLQGGKSHEVRGATGRLQPVCPEEPASLPSRLSRAAPKKLGISHPSRSNWWFCATSWRWARRSFALRVAVCSSFLWCYLRSTQPPSHHWFNHLKRQIRKWK